MKNKIVTVILLLLSATSAYTQARIGSTPDEIKREFTDLGYTVKSGYTEKDNQYYISITLSRAVVGYYFNSHNRCDQTLIVPLSQGDLNFYVELYNKQYVIASRTKWTMYSKDGMCSIYLVMPGEDDKQAYFIWSEQ